MKDRFDIKNKVVIITGGCGQLGYQYTKYLLNHGATVAIFDKNPMQHRIRNKRLKVYQIDIGNKYRIIYGLQHVIDDLGYPDVLINNAAIDIPPSHNEQNSFEYFPEINLDDAYRINLKGLLMCCQIIGDCMKHNGGGSIINISSIYGMVSPDQRIYKSMNFIKPISYSATKGALDTVTKYLATYWANDNIRVNTLTLGGVFNNQDSTFIKEYCKKVPLNRMAKKYEYNEMILYLSSDASSYMTGSNIIIDGGYTSW